MMKGDSEAPETSGAMNPDAAAPEGEEYLSTKELVFEMVKVLLLAIVIIIPIRVFFFQPFFVQGASMEPNFEDGEYLVISEFGYKHTNLPGTSRDFAINPWRELERQTPVVFRYPKKPDQFYIKRIIGLPGETVEIKGNKVIITNEIHPDGFVLDERSYLDPSVVTTDMPRTTLSDRQYLVLGDNRPFSSDSRSFGPVDKDVIIGRVLLRAWPMDRFGLY